jgi:MFS family permease
MVPVSFVLFAREATGSFASASLVLAAGTVGRLLVSPRRGRMVDRLGPRRALLVLIGPGAVTDLAFMLVGRAHAGTVLLVVVAAVSGAIAAPAATVTRSIWVSLLPDTAERRAGFALMSVLAEVSFFAGPLLAGLLVALESATLAVAVAAVLTTAGSLGLALSPAARAIAPTPGRAASGRLPALAGGAIRYVVSTSALFGLTFGLLDVAWPAFARGHGSTAATGLFAALFAVGSGVGGLAYGTLGHRRSAISLYPGLCLLATAGLAPMVVAGSISAMAGLGGAQRAGVRADHDRSDGRDR